MADLSRHAYLLRTDHAYRDAFVAEVVLRMAKLVEVLALRNGITFDENGDLEGLSEEEQKTLSAFVPAANVDTVREARPIHDIAIQQEVAALDPYAATPDPSGLFSSEKVGEVPGGQGTFLVDQFGRPNPNADVEEISDDQIDAIEMGGYFPDNPAKSPAKAAASAAAAGSVVDPETVATDDDEPTGDADGDGGTDDADGYAAMKVEDLQEELRERSLPTSGNKGELVKRLEKDDEENKG